VCVCVCVCVCVHEHVHVYVCMWVRACVSGARLCLCVYVYVCVQMCAYQHMSQKRIDSMHINVFKIRKRSWKWNMNIWPDAFWNYILIYMCITTQMHLTIQINTTIHICITISISNTESTNGNGTWNTWPNAFRNSATCICIFVYVDTLTYYGTNMRALCVRIHWYTNMLQYKSIQKALVGMGHGIPDPMLFEMLQPGDSRKNTVSTRKFRGKHRCVDLYSNAYVYMYKNRKR